MRITQTDLSKNTNFYFEKKRVSIINLKHFMSFMLQELIFQINLWQLNKFVKFELDQIFEMPAAESHHIFERPANESNQTFERLAAEFDQILGREGAETDQIFNHLAAKSDHSFCLETSKRFG